MKVVITAGGFGSRLGPVTAHLSKPLAPVGSPAFIERAAVPVQSRSSRTLSRRVHVTRDLAAIARGIAGEAWKRQGGRWEPLSLRSNRRAWL